MAQSPRNLTRLATAVLIPILLLGACIYFFKIDLNTFLETWTELNAWYLLPALALNVAMLLLRARRWQLILKSTPDGPRDIGFRSVFGVLTIGYLANQLFPAPSGEVARAVVLSRRQDLTKVHVLSTIVVERVMDVLAMAPIVLFVVAVIPLPAWLERLVFLAGLALLAMAVAGVVVHNQRARFLQAAEAVIRRFSAGAHGRFVAFSDSLGEGMHILRDLRGLSAVYGYSLGAWVLQLAVVEMVARSLNKPLDLGLGVILILLANMGSVMPLGPSNLGTFQALAITVLAIFRIKPELALSLSLVLQAVLFLPVAVLGLEALWARGLSIESVKEESTLAGPQGPGSEDSGPAPPHA
ncbi:MAG: lysylphosphatidylglycerol synthase transmembrane domain-containing protein [Deltaproteobacteria bacterium]|nr:lysylphosphatidylglycerol synthase transmembrane domain-containing protein [Deltaproteobacteria bacterium]